MPNIIEITDLNAKELDIYARLSEVELKTYNEPHEGIFIAESPNAIERALNAGYIPISFLMEKKHVETQAKHILESHKDIPVYVAEFDVLTKLTGFKLTRGMLCAMKRKPLMDVDALCEGKDRIVVLENVMNPTNVGAIIRSAAALSMDAVLLTNGCSDPLYRRAIRVSMGTVFQIPWTYFEKKKSQTGEADAIPAYVQKLKELGYTTVSMALRNNTIPIDSPALKACKKLAIIMGTEGEGLAEETIFASDYTVKIPMAEGVDSLNVAAASAVAFFELAKRAE